jgi:translation initiation factor 3 subunit C
LKGRAKWLKQAPIVGKVKKEKGPKIPKAARDKIHRPSVELPKKAVEEELQLTFSQFDRRIKEVVALRGKKGTEQSEQISQLRKLANYSRRLGPARQVVATMYILGAQMFDSSSKIDRVMSASHWKMAHKDLSTIMSLLEKNPGFTLAPLSSEDQADILQAARNDAPELEEDDSSAVDTMPKAGEKGMIKVSGDLSAFVERLSDEYTKSLQQTDPHTSEYISRLFDEGLLIEVARSVQNYYERKGDVLRASNVALIRAELIYYKHESIAKALHEAQAKREVYGDPVHLHPGCNGSAAKKIAASKYDASKTHPASILGQPTVEVSPLDTEKELREVCMFVFKYADIRAKTRAMLCRIYHHALHDRFHEARDLLLMSHIQDNIGDADIPTQILFNRMMAQLGLSAFRCGLIWESHACLSEICTGSRTKELLAQGMQSFRYQERDLEQERLERRRQVPYHMHINLELLETCHLISAMLLEVPNMVNAHASDRKRVVSKAFRKLLEFHERLVFEGPPENARDHVVAAAKLLAQGSWKKSAELIVKLSVWELFPGQGVTQHVKEMIQRKIQVESLRTYLLAFSEEYDSVSLKRLTEMFELEEKTVHSVVSKMMINEELQGAWDQSSESIVLHKNERSNLHLLALQYSEKLGLIVENNERMMDLRTTLSSVKEDWGRRDTRSRSQVGGDSRSRNSQGDNRSRSQGQGGRSNFRSGTQARKSTGSKKQGSSSNSSQGRW